MTSSSWFRTTATARRRERRPTGCPRPTGGKTSSNTISASGRRKSVPTPVGTWWAGAYGPPPIYFAPLLKGHIDVTDAQPVDASQTTPAAAAPAGGTNIKVTSVTGMVAGNTLTIDGGASQET